MDWDQVIDLIAQGVVDILKVVLPIFVIYAIQFLRVKIAEAKSKLAPNLVALLDEYAPIAVAAAEQMNLAGKIQDKFLYAFELLQQLIADQGIECDVLLIEAAIEAAVISQFPKPAEE